MVVPTQLKDIYSNWISPKQIGCEKLPSNGKPWWDRSFHHRSPKLERCQIPDETAIDTLTKSVLILINNECKCPKTRKQKHLGPPYPRVFFGDSSVSGSGLYVSLHFFPNKSLKAKLHHPLKSFQSHEAKMFVRFFLGGWNFQEK